MNLPQPPTVRLTPSESCLRLTPWALWAALTTRKTMRHTGDLPLRERGFPSWAGWAKLGFRMTRRAEWA